MGQVVLVYMTSSAKCIGQVVLLYGKSSATV